MLQSLLLSPVSLPQGWHPLSPRKQPHAPPIQVRPGWVLLAVQSLLVYDDPESSRRRNRGGGSAATADAWRPRECPTYPRGSWQRTMAP